MPTPAEHRALLFVAAVAVLGVGVRGFRSCGEAPVPRTDREALARQIALVDSVIVSGGKRRVPAARAPRALPAADRGPDVRAPSARGPSGRAPAGRAPAASGAAPPLRIDLDTAGVEALDLLPGIGPALAARIVEDREANGPFGSTDGLQRVKGIGPALAARLEPHVTFSLPPRPSEASRMRRERPSHP